MSYTVEQLSDLQAIRDAALRYCRGIDRLDLETMKSSYWEDATDNHGPYDGDAMTFCEHCMESHRRWRATQHVTYNHLIELDPDGITARGELYNVAYLFHLDDPGLDTWYGRYLDVYQKRGDEWRILKRVCVHEGTRTDTITPMAIPAEQFRQGDADRDVGHARLGP